MEEVKYKIKVFKINDTQVFVNVPLKFYHEGLIYKIINVATLNYNNKININYVCLPKYNSSMLICDEPIENYINSLLKGCEELMSQNLVEIQYTDLSEKVQNAEYILFNIRNDNLYLYSRVNNENTFVKNTKDKLTKNNLKNRTLKAFNI